MFTIQTHITDGIQCRVGAEGKVRSRNVVADGRGNHRDRNTELRMFISGIRQHQHALEGLRPFNTSTIHSSSFTLMTIMTMT